MLPALTPAALTFFSSAGCVCSYVQCSQGRLFSWLEPVSWWIWSWETCRLWAAHLLQSVWFSHGEEYAAEVDTLSDYVLANMSVMQDLLALSGACCLSVCLSRPYTPSTVRAMGGVCLPFLLNNGERRWRAPIRRSAPWVDHFSQVSEHHRDLKGYTLKCSATPQSVNIPLQRRVAFENAGSARARLRAYSCL